MRNPFSTPSAEIVTVETIPTHETQQWWENYTLCPKCTKMTKPRWHESCSDIPAQHMHNKCDNCGYMWACHPRDYVRQISG